MRVILPPSSLIQWTHRRSACLAQSHGTAGRLLLPRTCRRRATKRRLGMGRRERAHDPDNQNDGLLQRESSTKTIGAWKRPLGDHNRLQTYEEGYLQGGAVPHSIPMGSMLVALPQGREQPLSNCPYARKGASTASRPGAQVPTMPDDSHQPMRGRPDTS
jgi:hypothetical protein